MPRRARFSDYWNEIGTGNVPPRGFKDSVIDAPSTVANFEYLLAALRSKAPGQWSQNLLELSRHFTSAAFLAINTLANQAAAAEKKVMERTPNPYDGDIELAQTEPACRLLDDPNNDDSFGDLLYQITQQLSLTGIGLVWKPVYSTADIPTELYTISSASALPWPPSPVYPHGSYLIQPYFPHGPFSTIPSYQSAAGARIPAEQIIRIKNHHPVLRYDGYAVLTALQRQVDTIEAIDLARWNTQQKGVDPTIAMDFDPELYNPDTTDFKRLRLQLEALYAGPNGAGRILFNPLGSKVTRVSNTPMEMAWQEGWAQLVGMAMAAYGTPNSVAGLQDSTSYATLFAALRQFYLISLNPLLRKIADKFSKHLIRPYFGEELYLLLTGQKITDEDLLERQLSNDDKVGIRTKNERRQLRGLKPVQGGDDQWIGSPEQVRVTEQISDDGSLEADPHVERTRPENEQAVSSLGPQKTMVQGERLATLLDDMKHRGVAQPLSVDDRRVLGLLNGKH